MEKNVILIVTTNKYPNGDAGAIRQHMMARILQKRGYKVFVIGFGDKTKGVQSYENVKFISLRSENSNLLSRLFARLLFGYRAFKYANQIKNVKGLLIVDGLPDLFRRALKYARRNNIPVIHDSVEWYSPEEYKYGKLSLEYLQKEYTNKIGIRLPIKIIAISSYLKEYFEERGLKTIRVPVIMDSSQITPKFTKKNEKTIFVYAGAPGKKDYLHIMLAGFSKLPSEILSNIEVHIIGINKDQLQNHCCVTQEVINNLGTALIVHGRVPHSEAIEWVKNANATLLLRDDQLRYAKAGFPTKVVESMMYATPVICNVSSDLGMYLRNAENSYIVSECTETSFCETVLKFINTPLELQNSININARKDAERYFDINNYSEIIASLF